MATAIAHEVAEKLRSEVLATSPVSFKDLLGVPSIVRHESVALDLGASGSWDDYFVHCPSPVLYNRTVYLYYVGMRSGGRCSLGLATSTDGLAFTRYAGNPIMSPVGWEDAGAGFWKPCILYDPDDGLWKMWYSAGSPYKIGYATSSNGTAWTRYAGNPILTPASGETMCTNPCVIKFQGKYYMVFHAGTKNVLAKSDDGISWTRVVSVEATPPIDRFGNLYPATPSYLTVLGGLYVLLVEGGEAPHGSRWDALAYVSRDLNTWFEVSDNPIVSSETSFDITAATALHPIYFPPRREHLLYYEARGADGRWRIGVLRACHLGPRILWSNASVSTSGDSTISVPTQGFERKTFYIISNQSGTLYIQAYDEVGATYRDIDSTPVSANVLTPYMTDYGARLMRLRFVPSAQATVSAWAVLED
jgi:hypothetical protein